MFKVNMQGVSHLLMPLIRLIKLCQSIHQTTKTIRMLVISGIYSVVGENLLQFLARMQILAALIFIGLWVFGITTHKMT